MKAACCKYTMHRYETFVKISILTAVTASTNTAADAIMQEAAHQAEAAL